MVWLPLILSFVPCTVEVGLQYGKGFGVIMYVKARMQGLYVLFQLLLFYGLSCTCSNNNRLPCFLIHAAIILSLL